MGEESLNAGSGRSEMLLQPTAGSSCVGCIFEPLEFTAAAGWGDKIERNGTSDENEVDESFGKRYSNDNTTPSNTL